MSDTIRTWGLAPLAFAAMIVGAGAGMWYPFAPIMLAERGMTPPQIGFAVAATAMAMLIVVPGWGHLADTLIGRPKALALSGAATAFVAGALLFVNSPVLAVGMLFTFMMVIIRPWMVLVDAITVNVTSGGSGYARIRLLTSASYALVATASGWVFAAAGPSPLLALLVVCGTSLAVASTALHDVSRADRDRIEARSQAAPLQVRTRVLDRLGSTSAAFHAAHSLPIMLAAMAAAFIGHQAGTTFLGLRILEIGGSPQAVALAAAIAAAAEIPTFFVAGWAARRFGLRTVFAAGVILYGLSMAIWALTASVEVILASRVLSGVGFACLVLSGAVTIRVILPRELQATGQGLLALATTSVALAILGLAGGVMQAWLGYGGIFAVSAGLAVVAVVLGWPVFPRRSQDLETGQFGGDSRGRVHPDRVKIA